MTGITYVTDGAIDRKNALFPGGTVNDFALPASHDLVVERADGTTVWDTRGRTYQDHLLGSGPLVLGHAHPVVTEAVVNQLAHGTTYYLPNVPALDLAAEICRWIPSAEQVRFCSDGSEAVFYALRIARGATGRERILKFEGGFHGHTDYALQGFAPNSSGPFPAARPDTAGVPRGATESVLLCPYNDLGSARALLAEHGHEVAAIVVEPVQRAIEPQEGFLAGLRELADQHGCVLIFDEVVTGFRLHMGGAQTLYGVLPDLTTLGKSMSGGIPLACVVGPESLMRFAGGTHQPGGIYMSGTLNGNPLAAAVGLATVRHLAEIDGCGIITERGEQLRAGLADQVARYWPDACVIGPPAFPEIVFGAEQVRDYGDYVRRDTGSAMTFGLGLLDRGFLVRPGTKIYVSAVHTSEQISGLLSATDEVLHEMSRGRTS